MDTIFCYWKRGIIFAIVIYILYLLLTFLTPNSGLVITIFFSGLFPYIFILFILPILFGVAFSEITRRVK